MRSHRRRSPVEHALIVGGVEDLPGITLALSLLPSDAYGQVLIEAEPDQVLPDLFAPARVTIQRVAPPQLGLAVACWVAEWIPDEPDPGRSITIWVGERAGVHVDAHWPVIGDLVERL